MNIERKKALELIREYVKNENSVKHMIAVESVMKKLAKKFNESEYLWCMAGLVHDIDMEIVDYLNEPEKHGIKAAEILKKQGFSEEIIEAVKSHNESTGKRAESLMEKSIFCVDPLTGLIIASVLVLPSKKINDLSKESVSKRYKEKSFAKGANRDIISKCSEIGIELEEFIEIGLESMKEISDELNL
jgi:uncharacterized protein